MIKLKIRPYEKNILELFNYFCLNQLKANLAGMSLGIYFTNVYFRVDEKSMMAAIREHSFNVGLYGKMKN